jgi:hypothetical protein
MKDELERIQKQLQAVPEDGGAISDLKTVLFSLLDLLVESAPEKQNKKS